MASTYVELKVDGDGRVLLVGQYGQASGRIRSQLDNVDTMTGLMGCDATAELLYSFIVSGCAIRDVTLDQLSPPLAARCTLHKGANKHEIICRLAFANGTEQ